MKSIHSLSVALLLLSNVIGLQGAGVARLMYDNLGGNDVATLKASPKFPGQPDRTEFLTNSLAGVPYFIPTVTGLAINPIATPVGNVGPVFLIPVTIDGRPVGVATPVDGTRVYPVQGHAELSTDNFGSFIRGYIVPPESGQYVFFIHSDDGSEVWLSTDHTVENKRLIAQERGCCNEWGPRSESIILERAKPYYFEVYHKEGGGGDIIRVGWRLPNGTLERPIPARHLMPYPVDPLNGYTFRPTAPGFVGIGSEKVGPAYYGYVGVGQPTSRSVAEGAMVSLSFIGEASAPFTLQWARDEVAIPGAVLPFYEFRATAADNGSRYTVTIKNSLNEATSLPAIVEVTPDTVPAVISSAITYGFKTNLFVTFSEPVRPASAANIANYSIDNGIQVKAAIVLSPTLVELQTSEITTGRAYLLTVMGVQDASGGANATRLVHPFVQAEGVITRKEFHEIGGVLVGNLTGHPKFPTLPDLTTFNDLMEWPPFPGNAYRDNYGLQFQGYITAPVSGPYTFFINGDDQAFLYLSTDENPANKRLIGVEPYYSAAPRQYINGDADGRVAEPDYGGLVLPVNVSANFPPPIILEAGKRYYIEALLKEGGGGDHIAVAVLRPGGGLVQDGSPPIGSDLLSSFGATKEPVRIVTPLAPVVTEVFQTVTFSSGAAGFPYIRQQWYKNGQPIPGATGTTYTTPELTVQDDQSKYKFVAWNSFSEASTEATVTVVPYAGPAQLLSAAVLKESKIIGVAFNHKLDPATANTPANYSLNGSSVQIQKAVLRADERTVELWVSAPIVQETTLSAPQVKSRLGNLVGNSVLVIRSDLMSADIGDPLETKPVFAGSTFTADGLNFDVVAGGGDIWGRKDGFHFIYREYDGDFDIAVQVARLVPTHNSTKAGVMMREKLSANSRRLYVGAQPSSGANRYEAMERQTEGGDSALWAGAPPIGIAYPNAWVRFYRQGNRFVALSSTEGSTWTEFASTVLDELDSKVFVGMAVSSLDRFSADARTTFAELRNFSLQTAPLPPLPELTLNVDQDLLLFSWPDDFIGWVLQENDTLNEGSLWTDFELSGENNFFDLPKPAGTKFFRLRSP